VPACADYIVAALASRQFALEDLDVAKDRLFGVRGKAKNIAGIGDGAVLALSRSFPGIR
jgi:hypothetical protein